MSNNTWESILSLFIDGSLKEGGTWGGDQCRAEVSMRVHVIETVLWLSILVLLFFHLELAKEVQSFYRNFSRLTLKTNLASRRASWFELALGFVHFAMCVQLLYYKISSSSLITILQPCHIILLLQGVAVVSPTVNGAFLSVLTLSFFVGTLLAILFPDTSGLHQMGEETSYYFQHYLIQAVPFYLLCRDNAVVLKLLTNKLIMCGLLAFAVVQWSFYEPIDWLLSVNVNFMLCPAAGMNVVFKQTHPWLLLPSYRTFTMIVYPSVAFPCLIVVVSLLKLAINTYETALMNKKSK